MRVQVVEAPGLSCAAPLNALWAVAGITSRRGAVRGSRCEPYRKAYCSHYSPHGRIRLIEALDDRASFRRFCGFAAHEPTPERTAFVRFRVELVHRGLDRVLFTAVTSQLGPRGVIVRAGTLVDATLIPSASMTTGRAGPVIVGSNPCMATRRTSPQMRMQC